LKKSKEKEKREMKLINPSDLGEAKVDFSKIAPKVAGTYTQNTGKRTDKDIDSSVLSFHKKAALDIGNLNPSATNISEK